MKLEPLLQVKCLFYYSCSGNKPGVRPYKEGPSCSQCPSGSTCQSKQCVLPAKPAQPTKPAVKPKPAQLKKSAVKPKPVQPKTPAVTPKPPQPKKPAVTPNAVQPKKPIEPVKPKDASNVGANLTDSPHKHIKQHESKKTVANETEPVGRADEVGLTTTSAGSHLSAMFLLIPVLAGFAACA